MENDETTEFEINIFLSGTIPEIYVKREAFSTEFKPMSPPPISLRSENGATMLRGFEITPDWV